MRDIQKRYEMMEFTFVVPEGQPHGKDLKQCQLCVV